MTGIDEDALLDSARRYADAFTSAEDLVASTLLRCAWRARRGFRVCPKCETGKPVAAFGRDSSRADGLEVRCRACRRVNASAARS